MEKGGSRKGSHPVREAESKQRKASIDPTSDTQEYEYDYVYEDVEVSGKGKKAFKPNEISFSRQWVVLVRRNLLLVRKTLPYRIFLMVLSLVFFFNVYLSNPERVLFPENTTPLYAATNNANMSLVKDMLSSLSMNLNDRAKRQTDDQPDVTPTMENMTEVFDHMKDPYLKGFFDVLMSQWYLIADNQTWTEKEKDITRLMELINEHNQLNIKQMTEQDESLSAPERTMFQQVATNLKIHFNTTVKSESDFRSGVGKTARDSPIGLIIRKFDDQTFHYSIGLSENDSQKQNPSDYEKGKLFSFESTSALYLTFHSSNRYLLSVIYRPQL